MHLAMLAEVLHRRLGIDDRKLINYPGQVRYALTMAMPTRGPVFTNPNESKVYNAVPKGSLDPALDLVNFGDGGTAIDVSFAGWVARNEHDPLSQYVAENVGVARLAHAALWHQPGVVPPAAPTAALHDVRLSNDWVVSRTGWKADDSVVAFRSGGPANHEHADRNSVLFKAYGERLFTDHFKAAYVPTHPRWVLRLTEGHTSVLINGQGHQYHDGSEGTNSSWAWARVLSYQTGPGWMLVTSDATEAYQLVNDSVRQVERTLLFLKPDVLLILDRVQLTAACNSPPPSRCNSASRSSAMTPKARLRQRATPSGSPVPSPMSRPPRMGPPSPLPAPWASCRSRQRRAGSPLLKPFRFPPPRTKS
jgi:hypothetical protein